MLYLETIRKYMKNRNLRVIEPEKRVDLIIVMIVSGKGKTTSALGITLRAVGYNIKVCIIEFMKGDMYSGEFDGLKRLYPNIELHIMGKGFTESKEILLPLKNIDHMHRIQ